MRRAVMTFLAAVLLATTASAHEKCTKAECAEVKAKIRTIEARMRSGYTHAQGRRYEERLRELKEKRYKLCR
jgi:hypothetical protein